MTERALIRQATVLNSFSCNYPDVDTLVEIVPDLLNTVSAVFMTNENLTLKNDKLYCENLELDLYL